MIESIVIGFCFTFDEIGNFGEISITSVFENDASSEISNDRFKARDVCLKVFLLCRGKLS